MTELNDIFDRIVLVNLDRRSDRLSDFYLQSYCPRVERFAAIDGCAVPNPWHWKSGDGAWGCMQSHRQVLERAIMDGVKNLLVLEDDARFVTDFSAKLDVFMQAVPPEWDGLMLGGQHRSPEIPVSDGVVRCVNCQRTHAYAVRGRYMRELYKTWVSGAGHCDHLMGPMHGGWKVYAPTTFIVAQCAGTSDISRREDGHRLWSKGAPSQRLLVTDCANKDWVNRLIRQGAHVGNWRDGHTGLDMGIIKAFGGDEKRFKVEVAQWWEYVRFEAGAIDRGVPMLWHPRAIEKYDWLERANLGVPLVKVTLNGDDVLERLL